MYYRLSLNYVTVVLKKIAKFEIRHNCPIKINGIV
jgi:hypothetical protein